MKQLALVVLAACHAGKAGSSTIENAPTAPALAGYALVTQGAWLRSAPDDAAVGARGEVLEGDANLEHVWVVRVIEEAGGWVQVENLPGEDAGPHCYDTMPGLRAVRLRMYARVADLVPTTTRALAMTYADGSSVELSAGVAVAPIGAKFRIGVDDTYPVLTLDPAAIARSYPAPSARLDADVDDAQLTAMPLGPFLVDGTEVTVPEWVSALVQDTGTGQPYVTVRMACSAYAGFVEPSGEDLVGGFGYGMSKTTPSKLPAIREGAKLTWPDGTPAGATTQQLQVDWPSARAGCFRLPLRNDDDGGWTGDEAWFLELCAAEGDWLSDVRTISI